VTEPLFDATTYTTKPPTPARFLVTIGTCAEVAYAIDADAAVAKVIARRFPTKGRGSMAARVLPPDADEIRVRPVTAAELAAYGIE
jgi:hypothetical protein